MWSQPYEHVDPKALSARPPHSPDPTSPQYAGLVRLAQTVAQGGVVVAAAADVDYRELALNWYASAQRHSLPALVLALDAPVQAYLDARRVPAANLTSNMVAWRRTRLQRHIQRALMERLLAATALSAAGLDVLLTDASAVFVASPL
eukprot:3580495-Prymnesium_polylepis.1